jgi:hypothetical protein
MTTTRANAIETAREVDTRIAAAWGAFWEAEDKVQAIDKNIRSYRHLSGNYSARIDALEAKRLPLAAEADTLRQAAKDLDRAEYKGWTRFFLVKHIHRSEYCSSFRPTTRVGWLPEVSGLTEAEAVAQYDETLCTKCFTTAPVAK